MANQAEMVTKIGTVPAGGSLTLDWSKDAGDLKAYGQMGRIMIRNKGPNSVWFSFDEDGASVVPDNTSAPVDADGNPCSRWELEPKESYNVDNTVFFKIGLACAAAETAVVHASASQLGVGSGGAV
jgi:hypothetical protein